MVISTSPLVKTYTLKEFWRLPRPRDLSKLELIRGVLYMSPPRGDAHRDTVSQLNLHLVRAILKHGYKGRLYFPEAAIWTRKHTYLIPDLMYVSDQLRKEFGKDPWSKADLVIEVLSPSNELYDRKTKADTYRALGIRELWLVDTISRTVEVHCFETGELFIYGPKDSMRSVVLKGFSLRVSLIFK